MVTWAYSFAFRIFFLTWWIYGAVKPQPDEKVGDFRIGPLCVVNSHDDENRDVAPWDWKYLTAFYFFYCRTIIFCR